MAVGTPYGRGAYGKGPYARYSVTRPYGVGAYGVGPYARWGGNTFDVAGASALRFSATAAGAIQHQLDAVTSITWSVTAASPQLDMHPAAVSGIVFSLWTHMALTWDAWAPCEPGGWVSAPPCESGLWQPPAGCSAGTWTITRLT